MSTISKMGIRKKLTYINIYIYRNSFKFKIWMYSFSKYESSRTNLSNKKIATFTTDIKTEWVNLIIGLS